MKTYKECLAEEMEWLSGNDNVVFLGQGITCGDRFYGTLDKVSKSKCIEFPVAENLMMGSAIGLALEGYLPIVLFQRMDFMLIAADQIINHAALMQEMSGYQFDLPIIIRACVGSQDKKFDVGVQHNKNFKHVFEGYIDIYEFYNHIYKELYNTIEPVLVIEHKDYYGQILD
jgi:acetoin:2,6-dichlorophenolindophenol oxidoreductase subunit beta